MNRTQQIELYIWNTAIQRSIDAYCTQPTVSAAICEVCHFRSPTSICKECTA